MSNSMSLKSKIFIYISTFLLSCFIFLIYSAEYSADRALAINAFTKLITLPHIALSTSYMQQRVIYYDDYSNMLYPEMKKENKVDFVYAK